MERCPDCGARRVYDTRPAHDGPPGTLAWRHTDTYDADCRAKPAGRRPGFRHVRWRAEQKLVNALHRIER